MRNLIWITGGGIVLTLVICYWFVPSSGTFTEGALQGCVWVKTSQGTITRCPNSTTTTTYRVSTGKTSHVVSNTVVSNTVVSE